MNHTEKSACLRSVIVVLTDYLSMSSLAIDPRYIADLTTKGNFLNSIGNYKLAISYFDKALAINPKNVVALNGKKQALVASNHTK